MRVDLAGRQFGCLTSLCPAGYRESSHTQLWHCRCGCGKDIIVGGNNLVSGNSESCGCVHGIAISDPITHAQFTALVVYDLARGVFNRRVAGRHYQVGDTLGFLDNSNGYVRLSIESKKYWAHRAAWFYVTGQWPEKQIDHIDRNRANNAWQNLREATQTQNNANAKKPINNTSGYKGVFFNSETNLFVAQIGFQNKNYQLGGYVDVVEAAKAYDAAAIKFFGEYARINFEQVA